MSKKIVTPEVAIRLPQTRTLEDGCKILLREFYDPDYHTTHRAIIAHGKYRYSSALQAGHLRDKGSIRDVIKECHARAHNLTFLKDTAQKLRERYAHTSYADITELILQELNL